MGNDLARRVSLLDGEGLASSDLFSFGGGGNRGREVRALESEPEPRTLILVGMADRYDEGAKRCARVESLCCSPEGGCRRPTIEEATLVAVALEKIAHPAAADLAAGMIACVI